MRTYILDFLHSTFTLGIINWLKSRVKLTLLIIGLQLATATTYWKSVILGNAVTEILKHINRFMGKLSLNYIKASGNRKIITPSTVKHNWEKRAKLKRRNSWGRVCVVTQYDHRAVKVKCFVTVCLTLRKMLGYQIPVAVPALYLVMKVIKEDVIIKKDC